MSAHNIVQTKTQRSLSRKQATDIATQFNLCYVAIFGSTARNELTNDSDLDILIDYCEPKTLFELAEIKDAFEELTETEVDLVAKRNLKPEIKKSIEPDLIVLYQDETKKA